MNPYNWGPTSWSPQPNYQPIFIPVPTPPKKGKKKTDFNDPMVAIEKMLRYTSRVEEVKNLFKEKKEEKKEDKRPTIFKTNLTLAESLVLLGIVGPFVGILYTYAFASALRHLQEALPAIK